MNRFLRHSLLAALMAALSAIAVTAGGAQNPRELFERARLMEAAKQDPAEVIRLYEQAAAAAEKSDPALVAAARERVAALRQSGLPADRRLLVDDSFQASSISDDGRVVVGMNGTGSIEGWDLQTSTRTALVEPPQGLTIHSPVVSRDGRFVAFGTIGREGTIRPVALWVVSREPGAKPRVVVGGATGPTFLPVAWSLDGKELLVGHGLASNAGVPGQIEPQRLEWVSIVDASVRSVRTFDVSRNGGSFSLSPDGRWIAFTMAPVPARGPQDSDIFVMSADGKGESLVVSMAGANTSPRWTPDSRRILFLADRSGPALWSVTVENGRPHGEPVPVRPGMQRNLIGVSVAGGLYYSRVAGNEGTTFVIDATTADWPVLSAFSGGNPAIAPDGKSVAFLRSLGPRDGAKPLPYELTVRSIETGRERAYPHDAIDRLANIVWRPDGTGLIVSVLAENATAQSGGAFYHVNLATGVFTRITARHTASHQRSNSVAVSRDGRTMYMTAHRDGGAVTQIVAVDIESGAEREILRFPLPGLPAMVIPGDRGEMGSRLSLSPDGTLLALVTMEAITRARVYVVDVDGSGSRALHEVQSLPVTPAWLPDTSAVVLADRTSVGQLIQVSARGEAPLAFGPSVARLSGRVSIPQIQPLTVSGPSLSRDGSRLAFEATSARSYELWVLENVVALTNR